MNGVRVALALVALVAADGGIAAQTRGLGVINGIVSAENGDPVVGASVKFYLPSGDALEGRSDSAGKWRVGGIGKGEWRVEFLAEGYAPRQIRFVGEREAMTSEAVRVVLRKG